LADESKAANQVVLVVDRNFGSRLEETAKCHHTWIVETSPNRFVAETVWKQAIAYSVNRGVTTFTDDPSATPEELIVNMLGTIEEHTPI
jgi:hypothetical protein